MWGDQLARQWRVIRAIEASPNGLTVTAISQREETGIRTIYRDLEALQAAGFPLYTEKVERGNGWAFIDTFKFKIPPSFTLTELMSNYFYKDLVREALVEPPTQYRVIHRAVDLMRESRVYDLGHP
jgi:predicted DNA-binding transcriptional regulator YafY